MNLNKQLHKLNLFAFSSCLRITDAVWVVFLVSRGFSLWQVGLAEGIFHIVSLLCEIPSGMAADLIGRRRSLAVAGLCGIVSALLMAFTHSFPGVCLSMTFSALSCSFISGSDEALLYDSLAEANSTQSYLSSAAAYSRVQTLGTLFSNCASLLARWMGYVGFYLLDSFISLLRVFAALSLQEPTPTQNQKQREQNPLADLKLRFKNHVSIAIHFLRNHPHAVRLMLADGFVTLPGYLTLMFLQQRLSDLGLATMWLGLPVICIAAARMVALTLAERLHPKSIGKLYLTAASLVGAGVICAGTLPLIPAVLGAMVSAGAIEIWVLHAQKELNTLYPSDQRATLVSVNMMAYSVLMVIASPMVGWFGDLFGNAGMGLAVLGGLILLSALIAPAVENRTAK